MRRPWQRRTMLHKGLISSALLINEMSTHRVFDESATPFLSLLYSPEFTFERCGMTRSTRYLLSQRYGTKKRAMDKPTPSSQNQLEITMGAASSNSPVQGPSHIATAKAKTMNNPTLDNLVLSRQIALPVEVLETILRDAWVSIPIHSAITRWELFQAVRGVNRQWREVMLQVAIRNVVVHLESDADLAGYLLIGLIASRRYGRLDGNSKESLADASEPSNAGVGAAANRLTIPSKDILQDVFRRSSIFVHMDQPPPSMEARSWKRYVRSLVKNNELQALFPQDLPLRPQQSSSPPYLSRLARVIPDARRVSTAVIPMCITGRVHRFDAVACMSIILPFVASLPSAMDLSFDGPAYVGDLSPEGLHSALSHLPASLRNVRYLHFREYPSCLCARHEPGHGHSRCYISSLMAVFEHVEHLRIDSPMILKYMIPLPALHTLTLAAPLVSGPAANAHNSIVGYNIPAALKHGLFHDQLAAGNTPKIICITGEVEPVGWDRAQAACSKHGVVLIRKRDPLC
ncbi:hypothetical protein GY45DRAFT_1116191 [Cubamyces sp. BRFM 1775]|nr:hypothetical protein GY45DRAFT_1116191 [Cubamyces sp. BRFM 1775]